jgi:hypothetical protein
MSAVATIASDTRSPGKVIVHNPNTYPPRAVDVRPALVVSDTRANADHPVIVFRPQLCGDQV